MGAPREIYVNLPVGDLKQSVAFFSSLGFTFNPQFTDDKGACMVVNDKACVMLLHAPFFQTFTKRRLCDTATHTEALVALSCTSRVDVDELVAKAVGAGGAPAMASVDQGFMYSRNFYDLDGHHWEILWMDPATIESTTHEPSEGIGS